MKKNFWRYLAFEKHWRTVNTMFEEEDFVIPSEAFQDVHEG